jgi:hypothetical protein
MNVPERFRPFVTFLRPEMLRNFHETVKNVQEWSRTFMNGRERSGTVKNVQERSRTFKAVGRSETFILYKMNGLKRLQNHGTFTVRSRSRFKNESNTVEYAMANMEYACEKYPLLRLEMEIKKKREIYF